MLTSLFHRTVYRMKEVMDNTVTVIKNTISATPIDKDRLVVGTEDGLFCVDLERDGKQSTPDHDLQ